MGIRLKTGFENATLQSTLRRWLYAEDLVEVIRAGVEVRRRFADIFDKRQETNGDDHDTPDTKL